MPCAVQRVQTVTPEEQRIAAIATAKLTGERWVAIPMRPPAWGFCVYDRINDTVSHGCTTRVSAEGAAFWLNARRAKP
jgi:hypothetical protein